MFYHRFVLSFENEAKKQRRKNKKMQKLIRATVNMKSHVIILYTTMYKCESSSRFPNKTSLSLSAIRLPWHNFYLVSRYRDQPRRTRPEGSNNVKYFRICIECGKMHVWNFSIETLCIWWAFPPLRVPAIPKYAKLIKLRYQKSKLLLCSLNTRLQEKSYNI